MDAFGLLASETSLFLDAATPGASASPPSLPGLPSDVLISVYIGCWLVLEERKREKEKKAKRTCFAGWVRFVQQVPLNFLLS